MGASNIAAAFASYAGRVPPTSMQVLVYMALVAKDSDKQPWYSQGHHALAEHALGRTGPIGRADLAAVERALAPLAAIGAITTDRRSAVRVDGGNTARYRLHLDRPHAPRIPLDVPDLAPSTPLSEQDHARPTNSVTHAPRNSCSRPTNSVLTPHEKRGPKELEELEERDKEEHPGVITDLTVARARASPGIKCPIHPRFNGGARDDGSPACGVCRHSQPPLRVIQGGIT